MSSKKMIQINPIFLSLSKKNKTSKSHQKKKKRKDLRMSIKPNNIKKKLIQKIKEHQKDSLERRKIGDMNKEDEKAEQDKKSFTKDFNDQLTDWSTKTVQAIWKFSCSPFGEIIVIVCMVPIPEKLTVQGERNLSVLSKQNWKELNTARGMMRNNYGIMCRNQKAMPV